MTKIGIEPCGSRQIVLMSGFEPWCHLEVIDFSIFSELEFVSSCYAVASWTCVVDSFDFRSICILHVYQ